jgi:PPK2 family polyphosphate:nucleotide phosphotransferase
MNLTKRLRVEPGTQVDLSTWDPDFTGGVRDREDAAKRVEKNQERMDELQALLYAESRRSLLIVLQAMDAGGKDGTIRQVMRGVNPQGCRVTSFKAPSAEELAHDYLWRIHQAVPRRGEIGIFNRSHYEDVLVVRVRKLAPRSVWSARFDEINRFEELLAGSDVHLVKIYLHISKDEQLRRLKERLDTPRKRWKLTPEDFDNRRYWGDYMRAYEDVLTRCSTAHAPWYVIPANHKWFRNLAVSEIVVDVLERLNMKYPKPKFDRKAFKVE